MTSKAHRSAVNFPLLNITEGGVNNSSSNIIRNSYHSSFHCIFFTPSKSNYINSIFFRFLPPVRIYFKALGAIHTLHDSFVNALSTDEKPNSRTISGYLRESDTGFKELITILSEYSYFGQSTTEVHEICWSQTIPKLSDEETLAILAEVFTRPNLLFSRLMPECETVVSASVNNRKSATIHYGSIHPLSDLTRLVEDYARRKLAMYVTWSIVAWLILNTILILYINIIR